MSGFVEVDSSDLLKYVKEFSYIPFSAEKSFSNRVKDAKDYRKGNVLYAIRLSDKYDEYQLPLRAFNTVIFEEHFETIKKKLGL